MCAVVCAVVCACVCVCVSVCFGLCNCVSSGGRRAGKVLKLKACIVMKLKAGGCLGVYSVLFLPKP